MLDTETKRRIDTARDILVGKVPDPKSQVEQITIALIYKFMDDMDANAEELGGKRKFFAKDFARYGWAKLMRSGLGGHEMLNLYAEGIARLPENPGIPALFRDIFKNAFLPYRDPETLRMFLKVIDEFTYDHSERLGDAFEYLLSVLGSQGDAGQFRTPRHIIDFIVDIIDPKKNETILDPACGTAGFFISSYRHIRRANADKNGHSTLSSDETQRLAKNFTGYDIDPGMVRLSLVNLYLHGFVDPHIYEYDTLTSQERWRDHADVILANPPFMSPKGGIKPHDRFSIPSSRSEVLFLDYIIEHLVETGRAGIIVPEGIHFTAEAGYKHLRKTLIQDGFLLADISLPHGVFKPYASVKTHILLLDRCVAQRSSSILFVEIENDGFSQTDTREPIIGSQIDAATACVLSFRRAVMNTREWKPKSECVRAYAVEKSVLSKTKTIHLLGRWHDLPNRVIHRDGILLERLSDICTIRQGLSPNMATVPGEFTLVVPAEERKSSDHWDFEGKAICIPLVSSSGHGKADIKRLHYQEGKFALANTMCGLFVKDEKTVHPRYLYLFLMAMCEELLVPLMRGATNVTMTIDQLEDVLVPIPERSLQDEIVESHLIEEKATQVTNAIIPLRDQSSNARVRRAADRIISDMQKLLHEIERCPRIASLCPSRLLQSGR